MTLYLHRIFILSTVHSYSYLHVAANHAVHFMIYNNILCISTLEALV